VFTALISDSQASPPKVPGRGSRTLQLGRKEAKGVEELPAEERAAVIDDAENNPDPTTRRETIEQELMELDRSDAGAETGN
jgi:hypothetical protein